MKIPALNESVSLGRGFWATYGLLAIPALWLLEPWSWELPLWCEISGAALFPFLASLLLYSVGLFVLSVIETNKSWMKRAAVLTNNLLLNRAPRIIEQLTDKGIEKARPAGRNSVKPDSAGKPPSFWPNPKRVLSLAALSSAISAPVFYIGTMWYMESHRSPFDQDIMPLLGVIAFSVVWIFVTTIASIVAVLLDRKSPIAWSATVLSLIQSSLALYTILALKNLRF